MTFETVSQAAARLNVTARAVQKWAKEGKIEGAQKVGRDWMIPVEAKISKKISKATGIQKLTGVPFPMFQIPDILGEAIEEINKIEDEDERNIALGEYYYFKGELQKASEIAELYLNSPNLCWRMSAALFYTFANLNAEHMQKAKFSSDILRRELERIDLNDKASTKENALIIFSTVCLKTQLQIPFDNTPPIEEHIKYMGDGMKAISCYLSAYKAYLAKDYSRSLGIAQTAISCASMNFPIAMIYLKIMCAIDCVNLMQTEKAIEYIKKAWEIAKLYELYMPFVEHYNLLQGLLENAIKATYPQAYDKIISLARIYNTGWYEVYNRRNNGVISSELTPTEFTIAMLYSRNWRAKEIAAHMHMSDRTVTNYIQVIYEKLNINGRKDLEKYLLK